LNKNKFVKNKYSEENYDRISKALKLSKDNDMKISLKNNEFNYSKEELKIKNEETINTNFSTNNKFNEKSPKIYKDNIGKIENKSTLSKDLITIEDCKNTENYSIYFKEDLKNKFLKPNNNKQNYQYNSSIDCLSSSSSVLINAKNSEKFLNNNIVNNLNAKSSTTLLKPNTIDNLETFEIQISNRYKEVNISNDKITINSVHNDSKFFFDDISTKTLNTCSIKDDDFEEESGDLE